MATEMVTVDTGICIGCKKSGTLTVSAEGYKKWKSGMMVQRAFPELTPGEREQLISGMHNKCFDAMFGDDE